MKMMADQERLKSVKAASSRMTLPMRKRSDKMMRMTEDIAAMIST